MSLTERGRRRTLCAWQGRGLYLLYLIFCACAISIRHFRIWAFYLVSAGKHKSGYSPELYNSRYSHQARTRLVSNDDSNQQHWEEEHYLFKPCRLFHCSPASPNQHLSTHQDCWGEARRKMVFLSLVTLRIQKALKFVLKSLASSKHLSLMVQSSIYLSPACWTCSGEPAELSVWKFGNKEVVWQQGF